MVKKPTKKRASKRVKFYDRTFKLIDIARAVVVVAVICGVAVFLVNNRTAINGVRIPSHVAANPQPDNITNFVKDIYAKQRKMFRVADEPVDTKSSEMTYRLDARPPFYKPDGYNFYTLYEGGSSLELGFDNENTDNYDAHPEDKELRQTIVDTLHGFGLQKVEQRSEEGSFAKEDIYTGRGLVCAAWSVEQNTQGGLLACGVKDEYQLAAAKAQPFMKALIANYNQSPTAVKDNGSVILYDLKISNFNSKGYRTAEGHSGYIDHTSSATTLFYQKNGGEWKLFLRTQMGLHCALFNTDELRQAYWGRECYDTAKGVESLVQ